MRRGINGLPSSNKVTTKLIVILLLTLLLIIYITYNITLLLSQK